MEKNYMRNIQFGAHVEVHNLAPNEHSTAEKVRSKANALGKKYAKFSDQDVRIDFVGHRVNWRDEFSGRLTGEYSPTVVARIQVRNAKKDRVLTADVTKKVGSLFDEPIWKFFWRVRKETNNLISAANLKPE